MIDSLSLERAAELRREFDQSFQLPVTLAEGTGETFLAIRVLSDPYALRVTEISGLFVDRPVTPLPGRLPELLGIAGFRGTLTPVYCLATLLGYAAQEPARRWLVTVANSRPLALSFHGLDRHFRAATGAVVPRRADAPERRHAAGVVEVQGVLYSVIDAPALVTHIEARVLAGSPHKGSSVP